MCKIISSEKRDNFTYFFSIWMPFIYFSYLTALKEVYDFNDFNLIDFNNFNCHFNLIDFPIICLKKS